MTDLTFPYFYYPLPYYSGRVLKCGGIATEGNTKFFKEEHPGTTILEGYRGDRIDSITHKSVEAK